MVQPFAKTVIPAVVLFLTLLGAASARADAAHDVQLVDEPTGIPLRSNTYLVNTNAARGVTVSIREVTSQNGRQVEKGGGTYVMKPGEKVLVGHFHDSLRTTVFTILKAAYSDGKPVSPPKR